MIAAVLFFSSVFSVGFAQELSKPFESNGILFKNLSVAAISFDEAQLSFRIDLNGLHTSVAAFKNYILKLDADVKWDWNNLEQKLNMIGSYQTGADEVPENARQIDFFGNVLKQVLALDTNTSTSNFDQSVISKLVDGAYQNLLAHISILLKILENGSKTAIYDIVNLKYVEELVKSADIEIPSEAEIPFGIFKNESIFSKAVVVRSKLISDQVFITISIPIVSREQYTMFEVSGVPHRSNGTCVTIQPSAEHVVANEGYTELAYVERDECRPIGDHRSVCFPLGNRIIIDPRYSCELACLSKIEITFSEICDSIESIC